MKLFLKVPFLRILIPFVCGSLFALKFSTLWLNPLLLPLQFLSLITVFILFYFKNSKIGLLSADVFLFLLAIQLCRLNSAQFQPNHYSNLVTSDSDFYAMAVISDLPEEKEKFIKCELLMRQIKTNSAFKPSTGKLPAYFKKDDAGLLKAGETIFMYIKLTEPEAPKNPFEFDYKSYLANKQITHTAFINKGAFVLLPNAQGLNPILKWGLRAKGYIIERLKSSGLSQNAYSICAALITGYDAEVEQSVTDAFAHSGTLHVLSVSGLHTGLIYLVVNFLLGLLDRHNRFKFIRFVFVSALLWLFALITGFSAPVLRSVIMFNLFGLGKIYFRNNLNNQLNLLFVSAYILLLCDPYFLTDVGFILSYTALGGIIYFQPLLNGLWQPAHFLPKYIWQSVSASLAATIGTLPITLYYFKQFPLWFFVSNLVVVPLTFVLLLLAFTVVIKGGFISVVINKLVNFLIYFMGWFNNRGSGYVDGIDFTFADSLFLTVLIVVFSSAILYKKYNTLVAALLLLIAWQFYALLDSHQKKNESVFVTYHVRKKNRCLVKNKTCVVLNHVQDKEYGYHIKPHITSFNNVSESVRNFNYVKFKNECVLILNNHDSVPKLPDGVTSLVLANNFKVSESFLQNFKSLKSVIADGSNNNFNMAKSVELCSKFGLDFYSTRSEGAFILPLK
ncbi:MAG: ComEC family competence protein [Bacteroidia bacterium]|nr:ComEC family competence protein [Bacteroidia bacterium]